MFLRREGLHRALSRIRRPDRHRLAQTKPLCEWRLSSISPETWVSSGPCGPNESGAALNRLCWVWSRIEPQILEAGFTRVRQTRPYLVNRLHNLRRQLRASAGCLLDKFESVF